MPVLESPAQLLILLKCFENFYVSDKARARLSCHAHGAATSHNDFVQHALQGSFYQISNLIVVPSGR